MAASRSESKQCNISAEDKVGEGEANMEVVKISGSREKVGRGEAAGGVALHGSARR